MQNNNGFSLLEVLVALAIFTIGLLGLTDAQIIALRQNQQTSSQAVSNNKNNNVAEELYVFQK